MTKDIRGCGTALITPFCQDGSLDEARLPKFVEFQLAEGVDFLIPCGATGEESTLDHGEYLRVLRLVVEKVEGRVPVVAGLCGNDTRRVVRLAREVHDLGVDALLAVCPYYNRPTQEGIYQHFAELAEATPLPIILYNVPGRTALNMASATIVRLARIANIIGIKEASGNIVQQIEMILSAPPSFKVFSGYDSHLFPLMCLGAVGAISVTANECPAAMTRLVHLLLNGNYEEARRLNARLWPLMQANFVETSPIPVKAALAMMGLVEEVYRLPLVPMAAEQRSRLRQVLTAQGLLSSELQAAAK
jgi:4-hydroxy-tetrahydrodipicolinate synthase